MGTITVKFVGTANVNEQVVRANMQVREGGDLDEATKIATREMIDFLVAERKLSREDAYVLCSMAADLHVTQAVDGTKGVHMTIAKSIFK